jgi:sugar phosphate permease
MLDRTNVGNAKIIGMEKDLKISNSQYNQGLAVFYATYIASEVPSNLVLKKTSPKIWLPLLTVVWGIITMCIGFVRSFAGFVAVRALLGLAEGGLLPGIVSQLLANHPC